MARHNGPNLLASGNKGLVVFYKFESGVQDIWTWGTDAIILTAAYTLEVDIEVLLSKRQCKRVIQMSFLNQADDLYLVSNGNNTRNNARIVFKLVSSFRHVP